MASGHSPRRVVQGPTLLHAFVRAVLSFKLFSGLREYYICKGTSIMCLYEYYLALHKSKIFLRKIMNLIIKKSWKMNMKNMSWNKKMKTKRKMEKIMVYRLRG